jgi:CRISPR-associated protein Csm2
MNYQNRTNYGRRDRQSNRPSYNYIFKSEWITKGADDEMIALCQKLGEDLKKNDVSSSQLRNIYGEIMRIKLKGLTKNLTDFYLLKPKVAYNAYRLQKEYQKKFFKEEFLDKVFNKAYDEVIKSDNKETAFDNFQKFFEAILAYHKYYGGK